jgi:hypothetical protein
VLLIVNMLTQHNLINPGPGKAQEAPLLHTMITTNFPLPDCCHVDLCLQVCNHPDLFEGRPIVSSFDMWGLSLAVPSAATRVSRSITQTHIHLSREFGLCVQTVC